MQWRPAAEEDKERAAQHVEGRREIHHAPARRVLRQEIARQGRADGSGRLLRPAHRQSRDRRAPAEAAGQHPCNDA